MITTILKCHTAVLQGRARCLQCVAKIDAALQPDICAFSDKPDIVFRRRRSTLTNFDERKSQRAASLLPLNIQRSDKCALFRQEVFCSNIALGATRYFFVTAV